MPVGDMQVKVGVTLDPSSKAAFKNELESLQQKPIPIDVKLDTAAAQGSLDSLINQYKGQKITIQVDTKTSGSKNSVVQRTKEEINEVNQAYKQMSYYGRNISSMRIQMKGLDRTSEEFKTLKGQVDSFQTSYKNLNKTFGSSFSSIQTQGLDNIITTRNNKLQQLTSAATDLKKKLADAINVKISEGGAYESKVSDLENKIGNLGNASLELKKHLRDTKQAMSEMYVAYSNNDYSSVINKEKQLKQALSQTQAQLKEETNAFNTYENEVNQAYKQMSYYARNISSMQVKLQGLDGSSQELQTLQKQVQEFSTKYQKLSEQFGDKFTPVQTQSLNNVFATMQNNLARVDSAASDTKKKLADAINIKISDGGAYEAKISAIETKMQSLGQSSDELQGHLEQTKQVMSEMSNAYKDGDYSSVISNEEKLQQALSQTQAKLEEEANAFEECANKQLTLTKSGTLSNNISTWMRENTEAAKVFENELRELQSRLSNNQDSKVLQSVSADFQNIQSKARSMGLVTKSVGSSIKDVALQFMGLDSAISILYTLSQGLRTVVSGVIELDTAMTELKKTTDGSQKDYQEFLESAGKTAQEVGLKTSEVIQSAAEWSRSGFNLQQSGELARSSAIYTNVSEYENASEATSSLIVAMKAYGVEAENVMTIVDKFNAVGNTTATTSKGLGDALSRSASALAESGNTIDESIGLIVAANDTVQNPEKVGNSLKTISLRLRNTKGELQQLGVESEGAAESITKLQTQLLNATKGKVNIFDDSGNFKSTYQILTELSNVWSELDSVQQANITTWIAGATQANIFSALMQNMATGAQAVVTSLNSEGSAMQENARYMDSIQGRLAQLGATFEQFSSHLISSDFMKGLISGAQEALQVIDKLVQSIGVIPTVLIGGSFVAAIANFSKLKTIGETITKFKAGEDIAESFKKLTKWQQSAVTAATGYKAAADSVATATVAEGVSATGATGGFTALTAALSGATASARAFFAAIISNPLTWVAAAIAGIALVVHEATTAYDDAAEAAKNASEQYQTSSNELSSLNDEMQTTQSRISELEGLQKAGTITLAETAELEKLRATNQELERSIALKERENSINLQQSATKATKAANTKEWFGLDDTITKKAQDEINRIKTYKEHRDSLMEEFMNPDTSESRKNTIAESLERDRDEISKHEEQLQEYITDIQGYYDTLSNPEVDLANITGGAEALEACEDILNAYQKLNDMDLSPAEQTLNGLTKFFDGSSSKNAIRDSILEMMDAGMSATDALNALGLSLDDLGIDNTPENVKAFSKYFDELAKSADNAATSVQKVDGTFTGIQAASSSQDGRDNLISFAEYLEEAKADYDKGLTGTDNVQTMAAFMARNISADSDQVAEATKNFIANYDKYKKYLTSDDDGNWTSTGTKRFLEDAKDAQDELGRSFKNTGEMAREMGLNTEFVEMQLGALNDLNITTFDDLPRSAQLLSEAKTNIEQLKDAYDDLQEGSDAKDKLGDKLDLYQSAIEAAENGLEDIDPELVLKIKAELDRAQLQQEIDTARDLVEAGDASPASHAKLIASQKAMGRALRSDLGFDTEGAVIPVQIQTADNAIANLQDQLAKATSSGNTQLAVSIQTKIENLQDLQNEVMQTFLDTHPQITPDTAEANAAFNQWIQTAEGQEVVANITAETDNTDFMSAVQTAVNFANNQKVEIPVDATEEEALEAKIEAFIDYCDSNEIELPFDVNTEDGYATLAAIMNMVLPDKEVGVTAEDKTGEGVDSAENNLNKLPDEKTVTVNVETVDDATSVIANLLDKSEYTVVTKFMTDGENATDELLHELAEATNVDYEILLKANDSGVVGVVQAIIDNLDKVPDEVKAKLGIETEGAEEAEEKMEAVEQSTSQLDGKTTVTNLSVNDQGTQTIYDFIAANSEVPKETLMEIDAQNNATPEIMDALARAAMLDNTQVLTNLQASDGMSAVLQYVSEQIQALPPEARIHVQADSDGAQETVDSVQDSLNNLNDKDVGVDVNTDGAGKIQEIKGALDSLGTQKTVQLSVSANMEGLGLLDNAQKNVTVNYVKGTQETPTNQNASVNYSVGNQSKPQDMSALVNYLKGAQQAPTPLNTSVGYTKISSQKNPENKTASVGYTKISSQKNPANKTASVGYTKISSQVNPANKSALVNYVRGTQQPPADKTARVTYVVNNGGQFNGTAHVTGTIQNNTYNIANASGNWGVPKDQTSLVNELGQEIIVRDGRWFTVNNGYPTFTKLKKGDIVFNHEQTEALLSKGYVTGSHARIVGAAANGTAHASGTAFADGTENKPESFDWLELLIDRAERAVEKHTNKLSNSFLNLNTRLKGVNDALYATNEEIKKQRTAYSEYMKKADSVNLSDNLKKQVRDGAYYIYEYDDETKQAIEDYKKWYEAALDASKAVDDLTDSVSDLYSKAFEMVQQRYDNEFDALDNNEAILSNNIDLAEASGYSANKTDYESLIKFQERERAKAESEYRDLTAKLESAVSSGAVEQFSDEWWGMYNTILEVAGAIQEADIGLKEFQQDIRDLEWDNFDFLEDRISQLTEETDFLIEVLEHSATLDNNGNLTNEGWAIAGLHNQNYLIYMQQAQDYADEIKKIDADLANDKGNANLIERREELLKLQQESILAALDEKDAIKDLISDANDELVDSMNDVIDKYEDALDAAKDLYDYQRKVKDSTDNIAALQKQLSAYENDTSEETKARVQELRVQLKDEQDDLKDAEYDQYISATKKLLDDLSAELEAAMNARVDDVTMTMEQIVSELGTHSSAISDAIGGAVNSIGYEPTSPMQTLITGINGTNEQLNAVRFVLNTIKEFVNTIQSQMPSIVLNSNGDPALDSNGNANLYYEGTVSGEIGGSNTSPSLPPSITKGKAEATPTPTPAPATPAPTPQPATPQPSAPAAQPSTPATTTQTPATNTNFFISKKYTGNKNRLDRNGSIVDRLAYNDFDYSMSARKTYYKSMGYTDAYKGTASQNTKMLSWMKSHGFSEGGFITDMQKVAYQNGDEMLTFNTLKRGEAVLTPEQTKLLQKQIAFLPTMSSIIDNMQTTVSAPYAGNSTSYGDTNIDINIDIDHVQDYNELLTQMQQDRQFERMVKAMSIDQIAGKGKLSKRAVKWN